MNLLDDISPIERIRISGALASKINELNSDLAPLERVRVTQQLAELLEQLGIKSATQPKPLMFSLSDRDGSTQSLSAYLADELHNLPSSLAPFEAMTVAELAHTISSKDLEQQASAIASSVRDSAGRPDAACVAAFEEIAARSVVTNIDEASVLRKVSESEALLRNNAGNDSEFAKANAELDGINTRFQGEDAALLLQVKAASEAGEGPSGPTITDLNERRAELYAQYRKDFAAVKARASAALYSFQADKAQKAIDLFKAEGEIVLAAILAASPITEAQATEWASRQVVDDKALAKLARLNYKKADLYRDLAEFYRLTGGKSSAIRIANDGGKRANAVGVSARLNEKIVNIGSKFNKTVLFHELAHHLENDPIAKAAANGFLIKRRESAKVYSLKSLTGHNYNSSEGAYKDSFMNPYIGKVYDDGATEVFSMGVQYLANPKDAALFAVKDPEMFALVSGYLASPVTPAMSAKLNMHTGAIDTLKAQRQDEDEQYAEALAFLAGRVSIDPDSWWFDLQINDVEAVKTLQSYAFTRNKPPKYLGSYDDFRVFEGVFRNKNTGRNAKGYLVTKKVVAYSIPEYVAIHGDLDLVKAFIVLAMEMGLPLSKVWYSFFYEKAGRSPKKIIINSAKSILGDMQ